MARILCILAVFVFSDVAPTTALINDTSHCVWSDYEKLECTIKALDDSFSTWVLNVNWPLVSNLSVASSSFKSRLPSSLLASSSLTSSLSMLTSNQRRRERKLVTTLVVKCHPSGRFNSSISNKTFKGLESLSSLSIFGCGLTSIPSGVLMNLNQLKQFEVSSFIDDQTSVLLEVKENSIPPSTEYINLSFNNIKAFHPSITCNIVNLNVLVLSNNLIDSVEQLGFFFVDATNGNGNKYEEAVTMQSESAINYNNDVAKIVEHDNISELLSASVSNHINVHHDNWASCVRSIRSLSLNQNIISYLPSGGFRTLSQLEHLFISANNITSVSHESFLGLKDLHVLDLSKNYIEFFHSETLKNCTKLEKLSLNNNSISFIPEDIFQGLSELQEIDLSYNKLTMQESYENTFSGLRRLVILNLSHNKIVFIINSVFGDLTALQRLDLSFNELETIEEETFNRMFNLYELNLSNNKIHSLSSSSFAGLVGLNILNLSYNSLTNLYSSILEQSFNLKQVLLSNNKFEELPSAVQNLSFLNHLDMSKNNLLKLESYNFNRLSNLHVFNLSSNLLKNISKLTFTGLNSLRVLDISDNNIETAKEGALDNIEDLKILKLSRNKLANINGLFAGMIYLEELDLSENNINMFDYAFLPRQLLKLVIRKNKVKQLGNYYKVHHVLALQDIDASYNNIKSINEESLPNSIKRVSLEQNLIQNVKPGTFRDKIYIEYINFRMNQISKLNPKSVSPKWIMEDQKEAELYLGGNSLICDCEMEWLHFASLPVNSSNDNHEANHRLPIIGDVFDVLCILPHSVGNLTTYKKITDTVPDNFLCPYATHCFTLCHCCDFIACDCQMKCPDSCSCFHDDTWSINLVDCSRNNLKKLPDKIPMDATIVFLDGNNLKILHAHHFIGRHSIQKLYLNSSNIQTLHNRTFHGLSSLKYLYLQDNMIVHLNGFEFSGLSHLKELHLQNNRVSFASNKTFEKLSSLEVLRIDNNFIVSFPVWILSKNIYLKSISLSNNPWDCNCEFIESLREWMSDTETIVENKNELFCVIDGFKTLWSSAIEPDFACYQGKKDVAHFQFGQKELPFLAGGLCGGIILVTALVVIALMFARRRAVAAHKLGFSSSSICQEDDGKIFDAYISYSVKDASFVRDVLASKLENETPSYRLCLHYRDFSESSKISDFVAQSICFSRRIIIVLSKSYIENEWKNCNYRNCLFENIKNKENNLIVINFDEVHDCLLEYSLKCLLNKSNVLQFGEKNFWRKLSELLPTKSMYSGFSLYISDPLYKSPVPLLSSPRNMELPSSSSVLTSTTGLTTPSDAGRCSLLHEPQATYKNTHPPRVCHIPSCDYMTTSGRDYHIPSCHCQRIPQSIYSSIEGDSTSVHTYNSLEILSQQISSDRHSSPDNHQYNLANTHVSPSAKCSTRKKCHSSPGAYDNVVSTHDLYHQRSCRRRLGTSEETEDCASSSSISSERADELSDPDYGDRINSSPVLPGFPTDECFV